MSRQLHPRHLCALFVLAAVAAVALAATPALADEALRCDQEPYVQNVYWTTQYGPAQADVHTEPENFLKCSRGEYALCYYSGAPGMNCEVDEVTGTANCWCQIFTATEEKPQMVTIAAIQNTCVYIETIAKCGVNGEKCTDMDSAPVCDYLAAGTFNPTTDLISTFSAQPVTSPEDRSGGHYEFGCTECEGLYAGCMTAPCYGRTQSGKSGETYTQCQCPLANGPYQYGRGGSEWSCDAGDGLTWSAAYDPAGCPAKPTAGNIPAPAGMDSSADGSSE